MAPRPIPIYQRRSRKLPPDNRLRAAAPRGYRVRRAEAERTAEKPKGAGKMRVAPSLISADFARLGEELENIRALGLDAVHLDVMDGAFVPNITFGQVLIKSLRKSSDLCFDTHLMIEKPCRYLDDFIAAGSDIITVHFEATEDLAADLRYIRAAGVKAGVSVKPKTPVSVLEPYLDDIDLILIMTVEPGFGGQGAIPECIKKIAEAKKLIGDRDIVIEADGGATVKNAVEFRDAGCDMLVAGTAFFKAEDRAEAVEALKASPV